MAEIKTLHLVPREGMQVSEKPSVVRVRFGDGYEQRRPTGLNARLKTFQAVFRVTDEPTRRWLDEFYLAWWLPCLLWRPPKHNRTVRVVCREWSVTDNARYSDFSCTIEQVVN
ncbi:phage tail protein [Escherichia coli]|uniref:phage tail protein n=1 Tax=Escherichia coli TaxID=562 RepID=UPI000C7C1A3F|nr:phage tail protein [Escherichia coli]AUL89692.1 phage tail protein [Escherichia coli]